MEQSSGMWAPYEPATIGEPLELLEEAGTFVLVNATVREGVPTQYGPRDAVDLVVATVAPTVYRTVSGFAAGIVGQVKRKGENDLPAVAKIVSQQTGRGATRALELIKQLEDTGASAIAAEAAAQPTQLRPFETATNGNGHAAGHDDIPY